MSRVCLVLISLLASCLSGCLSGCSALVDDHECPGESCTQELRAVAEQLGDVPRVSGVGRVGRYDDVESDPSGLVEVTAAVDSRAAAQDVADAVLDTWRGGDQEPVRRLEIRVRPVHPAVVSADVGFTLYGGDGTCPGSCRSALAGLGGRAERLGADPVRVGRDRDDQGRVVWTWRLRARAVQPDAHVAGQLAGRLLDAARAAGIGAPISIRLDFRTPQLFSFSWKRGGGMSASP